MSVKLVENGKIGLIKKFRPSSSDASYFLVSFGDSSEWIGLEQIEEVFF